MGISILISAELTIRNRLFLFISNHFQSERSIYVLIDLKQEQCPRPTVSPFDAINPSVSTADLHVDHLLGSNFSFLIWFDFFALTCQYVASIRAWMANNGRAWKVGEIDKNKQLNQTKAQRGHLHIFPIKSGPKRARQEKPVDTKNVAVKMPNSAFRAWI